MTVKDLIAALSKFPGHMEVYLPTSKSDFANGPVERVYQKTMKFTENPDDDETSECYAEDEVLIIDEEE